MQISVITLESCSLKSSGFCWRGVLISSVAVMGSLIRPMAIPLALPRETLVLDDRDRLSGQEGLVDPEGGGVELDQPEVDGHPVANENLEDVSRYNVNCLDLLDIILACLGLVLLQSIDGILGVPLLPYTDDGIGDEDE